MQTRKGISLDNKPNILIVTPGGLPVPSVHGGAVQNLIENIIKVNEIERQLDMTVIGPYNEEAKKYAVIHYPNTKFVWVYIPRIINVIDNIIYKVVCALFRETKAISFKSNMKSMWYAIKTAYFLKKNNFDRVVIENNIRNFWAINLFRNTSRYTGRVYYHLHNVPRTTAGNQKAINSCSKILCVSEFVKNIICSQDSRIGRQNPSKVFVFKNCIDTSKFNTSYDESEITGLKRNLGLKSDERIIVFAGRLSPEKGIYETIEAIQLVKTKNVRLLVIGADFYDLDTTSPFEGKIKKKSEELSDKVIFTGYIDYDKMPLFYHLGEIAVLPSMWDEPAGLTMVEAMACGIPVITTNAGGILEYSEPGDSVIIDKSMDVVNQIALAIDDLLQNQEKSKEIALKGSNCAAKYNVQNYYRSFIDLLELIDG